MDKRLRVALVVSAGLMILQCFLPSQVRASSAVSPEELKAMLSRGGKEGVCSSIKQAVGEGLNARTVVKVAIEIGHNSCIVIKCAISAGGNLEDIITGANDAGVTADVVSRCCVDAGVEAREVAKNLIGINMPGLCYGLGYSEPEQPIIRPDDTPDIPVVSVSSFSSSKPKKLLAPGL